MISRRLQALSVIAASILLAAGFIYLRHLPGMLLTVLTAVFSYFAAIRGKSWASQIAFVLSIGGAVLSLFAGAHPILSLGVVLFSLAGWDLARFTPRIESITTPQTARRLQAVHLRRLGFTLGGGAAAGLAALLIDIQLSFPAAVFLGLAVMLLLTLSARELGRQTGPPSESRID
jgi:hypothetical protein